MELKKAVSKALKFVGTEIPWSCVRLRTGEVAATTGTQGAFFAVPDLTLAEPITVDCAALSKMLDAAGKDAKAEISRGKLVVTGSHNSAFKLQSIPETKAPELPALPTAWRDLSGRQLRVLIGMAGFVDPDVRGAAGLAGMRITPKWVGAATNAAGAIGWIEVSDRAVVVPPQLYLGLEPEGGSAIAFGRNSAWAKTGDQTRWTLCLDLEWPDAAVEQIIVGARSHPRRSMVELPLEVLLELCRKAAVVSENKAEAFRLTIEGTSVRMEGGDSGRSYGAREFSASMEGMRSHGPASPITVGFSPHTLRNAIECVDYPVGWLTVGDGPGDPIQVLGGKGGEDAVHNPIVETVTSQLPL